jgi:hypothetical protein
VVNPVSWSALEFEAKDRHPDWVWYAGLVALIIAIISFFVQNPFFGIFSIIAGAVVIIHAYRAPKMLTITVAGDGIRINEELIDYKRVRQFWLDETDKTDKLLLLVRGSFIPMLSLPLEGVTADAVRTALRAYAIPEVEMRESHSIKIFDRLGF